MTLEPFCTADIAPFLKLAEAENWVAESWEFEFLLATFPQGCFTARGDNGETAGFVTTLLHDRSGWIGNLIVAAQFRGRGNGEALFRKALDTLRSAGARTIWLTASKSGAPLYEKHGFTRIDSIIRWSISGRKRYGEQVTAKECTVLTDTAYDLDCKAWGDRRVTLLDTTARRGRVLQNESGFLVRQSYSNAVQIGPFSAANAGTAELLFDEAIRSADSGTNILVDAPVSNRSALRIFNRKEMNMAGSNLLMYAGMQPDYHPELLYGLATMGSCG